MTLPSAKESWLGSTFTGVRRGLITILVIGIAWNVSLAQVSNPALEQLKIAADAGDPVAQDKLAEKVGSAQAEILYRKAADRGNVHAQGRLGNILFLRSYLTIGVKPEVHTAIADEAIKWATVAANQGDKQGETDLSQIYLEGKLVKQDFVLAFKWGDLAAKNPSSDFVFYSGASMRDAAILKMNADQIEEAHRLVASFVPHLPAKSELPEPAWVRQIKLSGLSGPADRRLAVINGKTFAKGDETVVKAAGKTVHVRCLEIKESSVLVNIQDFNSPRELTLAETKP